MKRNWAWKGAGGQPGGWAAGLLVDHVTRSRVAGSIVYQSFSAPETGWTFLYGVYGPEKFIVLLLIHG